MPPVPPRVAAAFFRSHPRPSPTASFPVPSRRQAFLSHLRGSRRLLVAAIALGLVYSVASALGVPFLMGKILPAAFGDAATRAQPLLTFPAWLGWEPLRLPPGREVAFAVVFLPAVFLFRGVAQWGANVCINIAGLRVIDSVRAAVFARLQRLPVAFFSRMPTGDILQRLTSDVQSVRVVLVDVTNDLIIQPFMLVFATGAVVFTCLGLPEGWKFLLCLGATPLSVLLVRWVGRALRARAQLAAERLARLGSVFIENLQSPREVRAYNLEDRELARYRVLAAETLRINARIARYDKALSPLLEVVAACGVALAVWVGADIGLGLPDLLLIVTALYMAYEPVKKLGRVSNLLRIAEVGLRRLTEILDAPDEVPERPGAAALGPVRGALRLEAVGFRYGREQVLRDITLDIPAGQSVALVGPSGAGKSTLVNLIPRFHDPSSGRLLLDGADLRDLRLAELRGVIALVSQEPVLFDDTVRENIRLGRPGASDAQVDEAARLAGALEFIRALPHGMDTPVGQRGGSLSGGQRQRVAIARAFLKDAPVLLLDEATSALDTETERAIQASLNQLMRGRTTLIVAHRLSTIRDVDRIVVLDQGAVVADGTRDQVLAASPLFRRLAQQQEAG
jgi:ATP-binding cassette, subfamily B, bacterial MsbA